MINQEEITKGKTTAIISYILIVGPLIALSINAEEKNKYASFHIRQGLGVSIAFISLGLIISNFSNINIAIPMWIGISVLMVYGIFTAAKGEMIPLPLLGKLFQKWFSNV
jgi:uncharacterized membrane protein